MTRQALDLGYPTLAGAIVLLALALTLPASLVVRPAFGSSAPSGKYFDHLVTIIMENRDLPTVLAHASYESHLGKNYSLALGYSATNHPSEPNYCVLLGASTSGCDDNGVCCNNGPSLVDRFDSSGVTWKAYAEDASSSGKCSFNPPDSDHYPFLMYTGVDNNTARCANMLTTSSPHDPQFLQALSDPSTAPNFLWLTPNNNDNGHDSSLNTGDHYLAGLVPQILNSPVFQNTRAALFVVYDEGNDVACNTGSGQDCVYASWSGPAVARSYNSTTGYSHYSYVSTVEDNWGLQPVASNDASAPVMSEFFTGGGSSPLFGTSSWLIIVVLGGVVAMAALIVSKNLSPAGAKRSPRKSARKHNAPSITPSPTTP